MKIIWSEFNAIMSPVQIAPEHNPTKTSIEASMALITQTTPTQTTTATSSPPMSTACGLNLKGAVVNRKLASEADISAAVKSLSPLPRASLLSQQMPANQNPSQYIHNASKPLSSSYSTTPVTSTVPTTKLPSLSPISKRSWHSVGLLFTLTYFFL